MCVYIQIEELRGVRLKDVCCGDQYTMALTRDGFAFTWGAGKVQPPQATV